MAKRNLLWIWTVLPLVLFVGIIVLLWLGVGRDPHIIPSPLISKPMPVFTAKRLFYPLTTITNEDLEGKVAIVHVFGSWCMACRAEQPVMMRVAETHTLPIYGIDYKDTHQAGQEFLQEYGNPYKAIVFDHKGNIAINFGVYGTPELFIIDKHGVIRFKHIGVLTWHEWKNKLLPIIKHLQAQS